MLTTYQRNEIADDIIADVVRRVRLRVREEVALRVPVSRDIRAIDQDVLAIERQVAVQLLTGQRSVMMSNLEYGDVETMLDRTGVINTH